MDRNMKAIVGLLVAGLAGCKGDPTAVLEGTGPKYITASISYHTLSIGDSILVTSQTRDGGNNPMADTAVATSSNAAVAAVTDRSLSPLPSKGFYVKGVGPGSVNIVLTAGSAADTVKIVVFPLVFDGTITLVKTAQLDTIVVNASAQIAFDSTNTALTVDGLAAHVVSLSASKITAIIPNKTANAAAVVHLTNMVFLGTYPLAGLDANTKVSTRGDATEPNNTTATATTLTLTGTANTIVDGTFDGTGDVEDFYKIVLSATTTITAEVDFDGTGANPDIDMYILDATGLASQCAAQDPGCPAASGKQPEKTTSATLVAGTYYIQLEFFDKGTHTAPFWYRLLVKKNS